jgi:hypothetical protein
MGIPFHFPHRIESVTSHGLGRFDAEAIMALLPCRFQGRLTSGLTQRAFWRLRSSWGILRRLARSGQNFLPLLP